MKRLARFLAILATGLSSLLILRLEWPLGLLIWVPKLVVESLAAYVAVLGGVGALLGRRLGVGPAWIAGATGAALAANYVRRATAPHDGFDRAFGPDWQARLPPALEARMRRRRWSWRLSAVPEPRWQRDVVFWTIPGTDRELLCDIWQPPRHVTPSGLAFIYLHGSAWHYLDKDVGTRPLFRHLAAQGHVVMDVAYRLCPETDVFGMLGDAKRAIAWLKANAGQFDVDPERVVVGGGSAGGHLALLAAYAPDHPELTPADLDRVDASVRAVVSYYGPTDLHPYRAQVAAMRHRPPNARESRLRDGVASFGRKASRSALGSSRRIYSTGEMLLNLLGGGPDEVADPWALASPINHVGPHCPPTLQFHGEHDLLVPVETARALHRRLVAAGVPAVYVEFPQTEHAFDMALASISQNSPAAQAALFDLERFLALLV